MSAPNQIDNSEEIILGSGDTYICEYSGVIPEDSVIETDANRVGNTKGGASVEYSATSQTVKDDLGRVSKTVTTEETVKFKTGMITWSPAYIKALIATARIDETTKPGHRLIKIGGLANQNKKKYLFRFVHTRQDGRKLRCTITGKNTGTLTLAFNNENPSTIDSEITADTLDKEGTLVIFDNELPTESTGTEQTTSS